MEKCGRIATNFTKKTPAILTCLLCDFNASCKRDFNRHLETKKHKSNFVIASNISATKKTTTCQFCNKEYMNRSGLWRHRQSGKCLGTKQLTFLENAIADVNKEDNVPQNLDNPSNIIQTLIEQHTEIIKGQSDTQKIMLELIKNGVNNNNVIHSNSHNKSFNLNVYLNETCKDAMNISDFVQTINLSLEDLEHTGKTGYIEGISNIFMKNLNSLEDNLRPLHCSDLKREILYIRDNNKWEKEEHTKPILTSAIKKIANENIKQIKTWRDKHPGCTDSDSKKNDIYLKIVSNSMNGSTEEEGKRNINKIISNVAKEVVINKMKN